MPIGIVQFFVEEKGFGYIQMPVTKEEFYVHHRNLLTPIKDKETVYFVIREDKGGMYADEVKVIPKEVVRL